MVEEASVDQVEQVEEERVIPEEPRKPQLPARRLGQNVEIWGGFPVPKTVAETVELAQLLAKGGPGIPDFMRGNPGAAWMVLQDAMAFGMPVTFVCRQAFEVNGRVAYMSQLITALIKKRAPVKEKFINPQFVGAGDQMVCRIKLTHEETGEVLEYESPMIGPPILTTKEQKNPPNNYIGIWPKNSPLWKNDPKQQLSYYSLRAMARRYFPEILSGVFDYEEALAMKDITPRPAVNYTEDDEPLSDNMPESVADALERTGVITPKAEILPPEWKPLEGISPEVQLENLIKGVNSCATKPDLDDLLRDAEGFLSWLKKERPADSKKFWRVVIERKFTPAKESEPS